VRSIGGRDATRLCGADQWWVFEGFTILWGGWYRVLDGAILRSLFALKFSLRLRIIVAVASAYFIPVN
jgi:hypothetical protein